MYVSIDRFEGDFAICEFENFKIMKIPKSEIPKNAKEGDVIYIDKNGCYVNEEATVSRKKEIYKMQNELFNK